MEVIEGTEKIKVGFCSSGCWMFERATMSFTRERHSTANTPNVQLLQLEVPAPGYMTLVAEIAVYDISAPHLSNSCTFNHEDNHIQSFHRR